MPRPNTLGEAILRALGGFGQDVGGQMQANELYNQQAQYKNLWDRLNFEATQGYRGDVLAQGDRRLDIAQFDADRRFAEGQNRILKALSPQQPQFETEKDLDLHLRLHDPEAYYKHKERLRGPVKAEKPPDYISDITTSFEKRKGEQLKRETEWYKQPGHFTLGEDWKTQIRNLGTPFPEQTVSLGGEFRKKAPYIAKTLGLDAVDSIGQALDLGSTDVAKYSADYQTVMGGGVGQPLWQQDGFGSREEALAALDEDYGAGKLTKPQYLQWRKMYGGQ